MSKSKRKGKLKVIDRKGDENGEENKREVVVESVEENKKVENDR